MSTTISGGASWVGAIYDSDLPRSARLVLYEMAAMLPATGSYVLEGGITGFAERTAAKLAVPVDLVKQAIQVAKDRGFLGLEKQRSKDGKYWDRLHYFPTCPNEWLSRHGASQGKAQVVYVAKDWDDVESALQSD